MNRELQLLLEGLRAGQALLRGLRRYGLERDRAVAIMEAAEAEGREPTVADLRAELGDLDGTLDTLEEQIDRRRGEPE